LLWSAIGTINKDGKQNILWPDTDGCDPNVFMLRTAEVVGDKGKLIATVILNPRFSAETVERFTWLFCLANELWWKLRSLAQCSGDPDFLAENTAAFRALMQAGLLNPISDLRNEKCANQEALESFEIGEPGPFGRQ
jgi:hypothetical protein